MSTVHSILSELIRFDTTSSLSNRAFIDFIHSYLSQHNIRSTIVPNADGTKASLVATIGPSIKGGVALAGHTDTVPTEGQNWTSNPYELTERGKALYGRGTCDMKGFIACVLSVVPEFAQKNLKTPFHLAFTHDEETDMSGAQNLTDYMRQNNIQPEWVWIGEPTMLRIINSHKGVAALTTHITGIPNHSGQPDKGLSAIECAADFISVVTSVAQTKKDKPFIPSRFDPPYSTFNFGTIKGGIASNIIAEQCDILWEVRTHPGDSFDTILSTIQHKTSTEIHPRFSAFAPQAHMKICTCYSIPPLMPTINNPGEKQLGSLTGNPETGAVSFATEAGFFQKDGAHVVVCGPGSIDQAHQPNEFIDKSQLSSCVDLIRQVLLSSCAD